MIKIKAKSNLHQSIVALPPGAFIEIPEYTFGWEYHFRKAVKSGGKFHTVLVQHGIELKGRKVGRNCDDKGFRTRRIYRDE